VQAPARVAASDFIRECEQAVNSLVYDAVGRHGGSISAEHGIGALKRDEMARRKSPVALALMRSIKAALDPQGRMNPGRLL
jgi:FAD/FMN-containing dehydrogenase